MTEIIALVLAVLAQTEIHNQAELEAIDMGGHYVLANDIELAGQWTPLGATYDEPFYGTLDGRGHTISGLSIDTDDDFQALIGWLRGQGKILRLTVEGSVNSTGVYAALVVAHARSDYHGTVPMLVDVHAIGTVVGDWNNALLLARTPAYQLDSAQVLVLYCSGTGSVVTTYGGSGGLVGHVRGEIGWSSFDGTVNVWGGHQIGGLAGNISGSESIVHHCQVNAEITDSFGGNTYHMGGIAGVMFNGTIMHSWSAVTLNGCDDCGAIVGDQDSIDTRDVHWDRDLFPEGCPDDCGGQAEYDYSAPPMQRYCPSDYDRDGVVNQIDFMILLGEWTTFVDFLDLLESWGGCEHG
jgi:hypothetical protein